MITAGEGADANNHFKNVKNGQKSVKGSKFGILSVIFGTKCAYCVRDFRKNSKRVIFGVKKNFFGTIFSHSHTRIDITVTSLLFVNTPCHLSFSAAVEEVKTFLFVDRDKRTYEGACERKKWRVFYYYNFFHRLFKVYNTVI